VELVVHFAFGTHVPEDTVASWLNTIEGSQRSYVVTVRRAGAIEYLETLLSEGERRGVLARQQAAP
jgi:hypothetical protein